MVNKKKPLVTVYIPTKDREHLLSRALESVLSQTYNNIEVIIVDDASDTSISEYIYSNYSNPRFEILIIRNDISVGAAVARNKAVRLSKGEYVTGLDDDDFFLPERIEYLVKHINDKYSFIASNFYLINNPRAKKVNSYLSRKITSASLFTRNSVGNQALISKEKFIAVGGFDSELKASQDLDLWIRLVDKYGPALRLKKPSYVMDVGHGLQRITVSENRKEGTKQFLNKYQNKMSKGQFLYKQDSFGNIRYNGKNKVLIGLRRYGIKVYLEILRNKLKLG